MKPIILVLVLFASVSSQAAMSSVGDCKASKEAAIIARLNKTGEMIRPQSFEGIEEQCRLERTKLVGKKDTVESTVGLEQSDESTSKN
jgi:hypothetical protein